MVISKLRISVLRIISWLVFFTLMVTTAFLWFEYIDFKNNGQIVSAKVNEIKRSPGSNVSYDYSVIINYHDSLYYSLLLSDQDFRKGESLEVYFVPNKPNKIKLTSENLVFNPIASLLAVLLFLFILIISYVNPQFIFDHTGGDVFTGD